MTVKLSYLQDEELDKIVAAFKSIGWYKPRSIYEAYLSEQSSEVRSVIVAYENDNFCGYVTIKWQSDYPSFKQHNIPEIADLNVLPIYRNRGIGTKLVKWCEVQAGKRGFTNIGIGVGMTADYGNAQRLYVSLGFIPDGQGLHYKYRAANYGDNVIVDDDLVLYFTKSIEGK